jgi:uncharacterized protein YebE (UPF0316 family)
MILLNTFFDSAWFTYLVLPLAIFFARICDVTIGTVRIVMVAKGEKIIAPILGFFEVFIWLLAISRIFENLDNWLCYVTYAAGFATGNYIGLIVEEKLAMGIVRIQMVTKENTSVLISKLKDSRFGVTVLEAKGANEEVNIIYTIVKRTDVSKVEDIIRDSLPDAFYSIEEIKSVNKGVFPIKKSSRWRGGK